MIGPKGMKHLRKILHEAIKLDVEKGDVILTGRFKNKRRIVKTIGTDRFGQPTINGKSILKFKIEKHMPKNKMSAKTREEMNEMKGLRKAIRAIILESQANEDKIIKLLIKDGPHLKQGISLGDSLGVIRQHEDKPLTVDLKHEVVAVFECDRAFLDRMYQIAGYGFDPVVDDISDTEVRVAMSVPHERIDMDRMRRGI